MTDRFVRIPVREQEADIRNKNFKEVCLGYNLEEAMLEASRCLNCKNAPCRSGCPVSIDIPAFVKQIAMGNIEEAAKILADYSALPAVCGRVCPQESQCEKYCVLGKRGDSLAIGKLERFASDWARQHNIETSQRTESNGHKVAVIGSGPAGITCAGELAKLGYEVTIFEALHEAGGVLMYGIPEFRLPKEEVVKAEIKNLQKLGVKIENNVLVGRTVTLDQLFEEGFEAIFVGSGAGLPMFMNIAGENLNGVFSANEFLTRNNLMKSYLNNHMTPIKVGQTVCVVGGGNVAMDAARTAKRLGADVHIVYRRTERELPARLEEAHHAKEEGIKFHMLTNPVEILGDENGWVKSMTCLKMELGEEDESGRRRPIAILDSEFEIETDIVIMALGTSPNPLIGDTTKGLDRNRRGCIYADATGKTSREGVFAGGDSVTGAATVILAMGAGKDAAKSIDDYINSKKNCYFNIWKHSNINNI